MIKFVNLTPHAINVYTFDGLELVETIPPSGTVARVTEKLYTLGEINGIPVEEPTYGEIEGLPEPEENVIYIVSGLVRQVARARGRIDVVSPNTGKGAVRDKQGRIIGTTGFLC